MNSEYLTIPQYVTCKSKLIGKVATYDLIIEGMETALLEATLSGHIAAYEMDDGQMKVRSQYRSVASMTDAIQALRKIRQDYINSINGRGIRLVGGSL